VRAFKSFGGLAASVYRFPPGAADGAQHGSGVTCLLGHNGSGKSALLEALCFALGAPASVLRVRLLRELVSTESASQVSEACFAFTQLACNFNTMHAARTHKTACMHQAHVETLHITTNTAQLCEVKVKLGSSSAAGSGRHAVAAQEHELATTLSPEGVRIFRMDGRLRSAAQVKVSTCG